MRHLQEISEKYKDKGLVVLGLNCSDDKKIAAEFLRENSATFANVCNAPQKLDRWLR